MHTMPHTGPWADLIVYPESDGKPMADNTWQARWIITLYNNLRSCFDPAEVFIAADLLWYPEEGKISVSFAPDVMVVFGRPDGDRPSWMPWREEGLNPQVVFEVLSPSNSQVEMMRKLQAYELYGVEELIVIDPGRHPGDAEHFASWVREGNSLKAQETGREAWTSPRLGVRFSYEGDRIVVEDRSGSRFRTFESLKSQLDAEKQRAEAEQRKAEAEKQRADEAHAELERLRARLRELES
ncbi:MAG: Uma2 family endonuclease [Bacteroidia bacterium]|nr:Uma2 family endonuclease [Bacteroidia bacterium]